MTLLLLEALGAGLLFIGIIWWTMFSGRKNGEMSSDVSAEDAQPASTKGTDLPLSAAKHQEKIDR
jgi:hypothetical protein